MLLSCNHLSSFNPHPFSHQAGAEILVVHPTYLFASLEPAEFEAYAEHRSMREARAFSASQQILTGKRLLVQLKHEAPYRSPDFKPKIK